MITCKTCGSSKHSDDFYIDGRSGRARQPCKECLRSRARAHATTEKAKATKRAYRAANLDKSREANRRYRAAHPGLSTEETRRLAKLRPEQRKAHSAVWTAIKLGRLVQQPCEVCGAVKAAAHHDDYSKPLDVRWLCPKHHAEHHTAIRNRNGE